MRFHVSVVAVALASMSALACGQSASHAPNETTDGGADGATPCASTCDEPVGSSPSGPPVDAGVPYEGGAPADGTISPSGGTLTRLLFASVGDTRGGTPDYLPSYPTDTITQIFTSIETMQPRPPMVISTGDYAFTLLSTGDTSAQLDLYLGARQKYSGAFFPAMGNHECIFLTSKNCGPGTTSGVTKPYSNFMTKMLAPIGKTDPYYVLNVNGTGGAWNAKFVFTAPNAWTPAQASWLSAAMAVPTTYTFVVRHEQSGAASAPDGLAASEAITTQYPYTLAIVGHTHTYKKSGPKEVLFGNGGAPVGIGSAKQFGYGVFSQRADGAIVVDAIDAATGLADSTFRFAVKADGTPAP
jgi:hypothetical protein